MTVLSLDNLRHETRHVIRIAACDVAKRLCNASLILGLCWAAGARWPVALVAALILVCEASAQLIARAEPPPDQEIPIWLVAWMWLTNIPSTVIFLVPAAILASQAETPLVLTGFLWTFGVYVHVSNRFVMLPFYNWCQMVPAFAMGLGMVGLAAQRPAAAGEGWLWIGVAALFVAYCINTVGTMTAQKQFHRELAEARAEAGARLLALERAARLDPLTGLLNRQAFDASLHAMLGAARPGRTVAVLSLDLDGFKPLNDTYGHAAGDAALAAVGRRLAAMAGPGGAAGRLGGDEFALAVPGMPSERAALDLARRLAREVERPLLHDGRALSVGSSVGVALGDGGALSSTARPDTAAEGLLDAADRSMLLAKSMGRLGGEARAVLHDPRSDPPRARPGDRARLAQALAQGEVGPRYVPILDLATGALAGFEARATWEGRPEGREERTALLARVPELGLRGDLLLAMTGRVLADLDRLLERGLDPGRVALAIPDTALATRTGRDDLDRLLAAHPGGRSRLVLGLHADVLAARAGDLVRDGVGHLRAMGTGIAIRGFGTGQACFRHLGEVAFDELRVDARFVAGLGRDGPAATAMAAVALMARGLGATLVAEGVEAEDQRRQLLAAGCGLGLGPLLGGALDLDGVHQAVEAATYGDPRGEALRPPRALAG